MVGVKALCSREIVREELAGNDIRDGRKKLINADIAHASLSRRWRRAGLLI